MMNYLTSFSIMASYQPPDPDYQASNVFPPVFWQYGGSRLDDELKAKFNHVYPDGVSREAQHAISRDHQIDGYSGAWFNYIWKLADEWNSPVVKMYGLAMCITKGWHEVIDDWIARDTSLDIIEIPGTGKQKTQHKSVLSLSVGAMRGSQINSPWQHPHQQQAFVKLLEAGANPNDLDFQTKKYILFYLPMLSPLLDHGMDLWRRQPNEDHVIKDLGEIGYPNASLLARQRTLQEMFKKGLPLSSPYENISLVDFLSKTSLGVQTLPELYDLYPAHQTLEPFKKHYDQIKKKILKMPEDKSQLLKVWLDRLDIDLYTSPISSFPTRSSPRL